MIRNTIFTLKLFFWHACIILCWVFLQVDMQKLIKNECIQKQLAYRTHSCKQPLVWEPTPLSTVPLYLGFEDHIRHYILYISLVALIAKVILNGWKLAQSGPRTYTCKLPLVWEPTHLSIEPLCLGFGNHNCQYILNIWNIFGNYWTWVWKPGQVLVSSNPSGSTCGVNRQSFFALSKTCSEGASNPTCKLPLVWEPTPLSIEPLWLGLEDHIRHYI